MKIWKLKCLICLLNIWKTKGRKRYEISNFAISGFESTHNLLYWENETYAGIGAGAHGHISGKRYSNIGPIKRYMEQVDNGVRPIQHSHIVTVSEAMEEEMFLGLRKTDGISASIFQEKFGQSLNSVYGQTIQSLIDKGLIEKNGDKSPTYTKRRFSWE